MTDKAKEILDSVNYDSFNDGGYEEMFLAVMKKAMEIGYDSKGISKEDLLKQWFDN